MEKKKKENQKKKKDDAHHLSLTILVSPYTCHINYKKVDIHRFFYIYYLYTYVDYFSSSNFCAQRTKISSVFLPILATSFATACQYSP